MYIPGRLRTGSRPLPTSGWSSARRTSPRSRSRPPPQPSAASARACPRPRRTPTSFVPDRDGAARRRREARSRGTARGRTRRRLSTQRRRRGCTSAPRVPRRAAQHDAASADVEPARGCSATRAARTSARARVAPRSDIEPSPVRLPAKRLSGPRPPRPVGPRPPRCSVSRNSSRRRVTSCTGTSLNGASAYVSPPRVCAAPAPLGFVRASIRRVQKGEISPPRAPTICDDARNARPETDARLLSVYKNCRALHAFALKGGDRRPSRRSPRGWFPYAAGNDVKQSFPAGMLRRTRAVHRLINSAFAWFCRRLGEPTRSTRAIVETRRDGVRPRGAKEAVGQRRDEGGGNSG